MTLMEREFAKDAAIRKACANEGLGILFFKCGLGEVDLPQRIERPGAGFWLPRTAGGPADVRWALGRRASGQGIGHQDGRSMLWPGAVSRRRTRWRRVRPARGAGTDDDRTVRRIRRYDARCVWPRELGGRSRCSCRFPCQGRSQPGECRGRARSRPLRLVGPQCRLPGDVHPQGGAGPHSRLGRSTQNSRCHASRSTRRAAGSAI